MTKIEHKTRLMMTAALQGAKDNFAQAGELLPVWMIEKADGDIVVIGTPFDGPDCKRTIAATIREAMRELHAVRYVFISEAWMLSDIKGIPESVLRGGSVANHPDRIEVITVHGEDRGAAAQVYCQILRPEHGPPKLGRDHWMDSDAHTGRFARLLPQ